MRLFDHLKIKFCICSISNTARNSDTEVISVHLLKSICLPVILYGVEVMQPSRSMLHMLDNLINRAVYRMFGFVFISSCCLILMLIKFILRIDSFV